VTTSPDVDETKRLLDPDVSSSALSIVDTELDETILFCSSCARLRMSVGFGWTPSVGE
jgi:hypothetical protein